MKNQFFKVNSPTMAWVKIGYVPSNTYIGNSQACDNVYAHVEVNENHQVHVLVGGDFLVTDENLPGRAVTFSMPQDQSVLLKSYGVQKKEDFSSYDFLDEISQEESYNRLPRKLVEIDMKHVKRMSANSVAMTLNSDDIIEIYAPDLVSHAEVKNRP